MVYMYIEISFNVSNCYFIIFYIERCGSLVELSLDLSLLSPPPPPSSSFPFFSSSSSSPSSSSCFLTLLLPESGLDSDPKRHFLHLMQEGIRGDWQSAVKAASFWDTTPLRSLSLMSSESKWRNAPLHCKFFLCGVLLRKVYTKLWLYVGGLTAWQNYSVDLKKTILDISVCQYIGALL